MKNYAIRLAKRPVGLPEESDWNYGYEELDNLEEGQILIEQKYISLDPAMRGWMNDSRSYIKPVELGDVMRAGSVGVVIEAKGESKFNVGDHVVGAGGVQKYVLTDGKDWMKVDPNLAPLAAYLGPLGMTGLTAYFGILRKGDIKEGETVLVSGAAGAVGSMVGQIAKIKGCKVVGIAGSDEKCEYVTDTLGFDACINYKTENIKASIKNHCSEGVDVYFDNVGGEILDAALIFINKHARIVICGAISQYNNKEAIKGPSNYLSLLVNRARMEGMVVFDWADEYLLGIQDIAQWIMAGKIKFNIEEVEGIENFYEAFLKLFTGNKLGKLVLKV